MSEDSTKEQKSSLKAELEKNAKLQQELTRLRKTLSQEQRINKENKDENDKFTQLLVLREEEGRRSISRELHDQISQVLTGINFELAVLIKEATASGRHLLDKIYDTQKLVEQSVEAVHEFAKELRPMILDDLGLVPALRAYFSDFYKRTSVPIDFRISSETLSLEDPIKTALFRVVQESLTNVSKHARAKKVKVMLKKKNNSIYFEIEDDGIGFDSQKVQRQMGACRIGLLGMKERVKLVGGEFNLLSSKEHGTVVSGTIPLQ